MVKYLVTQGARASSAMVFIQWALNSSMVKMEYIFKKENNHIVFQIWLYE